MVGNVPVGGDAPVSIQSMLNTKTTDVEGSLNQIRALRAAGCQIVRLAVPDMDAAKGFSASRLKEVMQKGYVYVQAYSVY